jgi:hypothetical protein
VKRKKEEKDKKEDRASKRPSMVKREKEQKYENWMGLLDGLEEELKTVAPEKKNGTLIENKDTETKPSRDSSSTPTEDRATRTSTSSPIPKRISVKDLGSLVAKSPSQPVVTPVSPRSQIEGVGLVEDTELDMMLKDLCEGTF